MRGRRSKYSLLLLLLRKKVFGEGNHGKKERAGPLQASLHKLLSRQAGRRRVAWVGRSVFAEYGMG